jgi:hypothetical protein
MRKAICLALALLVALPSASGQENMASQINAMPPGAKIELRLTNHQTVRGTMGQVANAAFTFVDSRTGARQIAFDEVASVKQLKSHTTRNVLIVVAVGVAALGITAGIIFRCGALGCGKIAW